MELLEALGKLDPENDEHWTDDGLPAEAAVAELVGEPVGRTTITYAAPQFTRENRTLPEPAAPRETREVDTEEQVSAKTEEYTKKVAELNAKAEQIHKLQAEMAEIRTWCSKNIRYAPAAKEYNATENQKTIMAYLKSQQEQRRKRGQAQIDKAMAAKRARGTQRPTKV